ncbi:MAG: PAS domain-containing protein [Pseudomonadota bacterium]
MRDTDARRLALASYVPDGFIEVDEAWRIITCADPVYRLINDDAVGRDLWELFPVEVGSPCYSNCLRAMETRAESEFLDYHSQSDRWFIVRISPTARGLVIGYRDVTAHLGQGVDLRAGWELMRNAIDHMPVGIWLLDRDGTIIATNPEARRIWGGTRHVGIEGYCSFLGWNHGTGTRSASGPARAPSATASRCWTRRSTSWPSTAPAGPSATRPYRCGRGTAPSWGQSPSTTTSPARRRASGHWPTP